MSFRDEIKRMKRIVEVRDWYDAQIHTPTEWMQQFCPGMADKDVCEIRNNVTKARRVIADLKSRGYGVEYLDTETETE